MFDTTTIIIIALAVVSVAAFVAGICFHAERLVKRIAGPAEERSGRELIKEEVRRKLVKMEAAARVYRTSTQEEAWGGVADFGSGIAASAVARSPSGRAAQAEREHAAS